MQYICYARELGLRKGAWPQSQATCRRATVFAPGTRFPTFRPSRQRSIAKELTEPEYRALSKSANFRLTRVIPTNSAVSIVEAIPA